MAFDVCFRKPGKPIERRAFAAHFEGRDFYTVEAGTVGLGANYESDETKVYFTFGWMPEECSLTINLLRPGFFAREAAIEAEAFAEALGGLEARDDWEEAWHPFDADVLFANWRVANASAIDAVRDREPEILDEFVFLPADRLDAMWAWNRTVEDNLETYIDDYPRAIITPVSVFEIDGAFELVTTWPADSAIAIPDICSTVVVLDSEEGRYRIVRRAAMEPALDRLGRRPEGVAGTVLPAFDPDAPPEPLDEILERAARFEECAIFSIPADHLLDRD